MSEFKNGSGDIANTTIPAAVVELLEKNQMAERATSSASNLITAMNYNGETGQLTFSGTLNTTATQSAQGVDIVAVDDLGASGAFNPGTGGDLSANNLRGALYQMLQLLRDKQPETTYLTSLTRNELTGVVNFTGQFAITTSMNAGVTTHPVSDFPS